MCVAIIGSAVLYQEFRDIAFSRFVNFAFGVRQSSHWISLTEILQIATTFLGVHLLTSLSQSDSDSDDDSDPEPSSSTPNRPHPPQRTISSASQSLLLPLSAYERTPLLSTSAKRRPSDTPSTTSPILGKVRLVKRSSTNDFTSGLSQAGFLLMATTPPTGPAMAGTVRRDRSVSRGQGDLESAGRRTSYVGRAVS